MVKYGQPYHIVRQAVSNDPAAALASGRPHDLDGIFFCDERAGLAVAREHGRYMG